MNKKKIIIFIITIFIILLIIVLCKRIKNSKDSEKYLTLNEVKEIANKKEDVSWLDFKKYSGKEIGSGLRIIYYEIEGDYDLMIGGTNEEEKPMYVRLVLDNNTEKYIDIRYESIDDFIKNN